VRLEYVARRAGVALTVLFLAVCLNFAMIRAAPGEYQNYFALQQGAALTAHDLQEIRASYGLDQPVPVQFLDYLRQTLSGNFGRSYADGQPVTGKLWAAAKNSILLVLLGTLGGILLGVSLGTIAGSRRGGPLDTGIVAGTSVIYSLPGQWIGMVLLTLLAGTFPVGGMQDPFSLDTGLVGHVADIAWHLVLPTLTIALITFSSYTLVTRSSVLEVMREDFIVLARAKGFTNLQILTREVLRNALLPVLSLAALSIGHIFGGALLVEVVFSWPGLGLMAYNAISLRDYPVIEATFLTVTAGVVVMNFIADCLQGVLDPRVRAR
jgi:peptide/nickel transport system permease protein